MTELEDSITQNVRDALNGDIEACKRLNLLLQLPFSSIQKLFHTSEESKYALSFIAALKAKEKDRDAINYCKKHLPEAIPQAIKK